MGKIVVLTGSPRRHGNTFNLVHSFTEAASLKGHQVLQFDTAFMKISGCRGCNKCYSTGNACIYRHDFNKMAGPILESDFIQIAAPVYWYTFPAQIKAAMDHFYAFIIGTKNLKGKQCALISSCAENSLETFDGIRFSFEKTMHYLQCHIVDEILIPALESVEDLSYTDGKKRAAQLALSLNI